MSFGGGSSVLFNSEFLVEFAYFGFEVADDHFVLPVDFGLVVAFAAIDSGVEIFDEVAGFAVEVVEVVFVGLGGLFFGDLDDAVDDGL